MIKYLNKINIDTKKFENIKLEWFEDDLIIKFIRDGWVSESYIAIKSYFIDSKIKSAFFVFKEKNVIYKERIDIKKLEKIGYKDYIKLIRDKNLKLLDGSDNFDIKNIESLELRGLKDINVYPTVLGCDKIIEVIHWEIST